LKDLDAGKSQNPTNRRSFIRRGLLAGSATVGAGLMASNAALGESRRLTRGDIAILTLLAAAELIEADLWQQYAELGGITPGQVPVETAPFTPMNNYQAALMNLDSDGPQYITSNNLDEQSHAAFLNAYLQSVGAPAVNFDQYRTLPSSQADGAQNMGRLTNLMNLTVDTSWFTRYHSSTNPDFGATFAQAITLANVPGIPRTNADFGLSNIQAIANIAAFHFGFIEPKGLQSGSLEDHAEYRRRRIVPFSGMGGFFGECGATDSRATGGGERASGVPEFRCGGSGKPEPSASDELDLSRAVRIH
jgi:hypothetical protein